jgi:hypothetical protein
MSDEITYGYFCALGGLGGYVGQQGRLWTSIIRHPNGSYYTKYYMVRKEA